MTTFLTVLIVEPQIADAVWAVGALSAGGFSVTVADFVQARTLLTSSPPRLLVADVRQGEFNGLQLVLRGQAARPHMAALLTSHHADVVVQREAEALGATFVMKPTTDAELCAAALRTMARVPGSPAIRPPFERRIAERRQVVHALDGAERRRGERRQRNFTGLGV